MTDKPHCDFCHDGPLANTLGDNTYARTADVTAYGWWACDRHVAELWQAIAHSAGIKEIWP